jgi:hypothetical protein
VVIDMGTPYERIRALGSLVAPGLQAQCA